MTNPHTCGAPLIEGLFVPPGDPTKCNYCAIIAAKRRPEKQEQHDKY